MKRRNDRGAALLTSVVLALFVAGLSATFFLRTNVETQTQTAHGDAVKALTACESALNETLQRLRRDGAARQAGRFVQRGATDGLPWAAEAAELSPGVWRLTCVARSGDVYRAIRAFVEAETDLDALFGDAALSIAGDMTRKGKVRIHIKKPRDRGRARDADGLDADDENEDWTSVSESPIALDGFDEAGGRDVPGLAIQDAALFTETASRLAREIARGKIPADAVIGAPTNLFPAKFAHDDDGQAVEMSLAPSKSPRLTHPRLNAIAGLMIESLERGAAARPDVRISGKDAKIAGRQTLGTPDAPRVTVIDADKTTLQPGAVVTGAGTLIVRGDLRILNGASLKFQGNIFVLGGDRRKDATLRNQNGTLDVDGNVLVLGGDRAHGRSRFLLHDDDSLKNDAVTRISGSVLALTGDASDREEKAEVRIKTGDVSIRGLLGAVGDTVRLDVEDHRDRDGRESRFRLHGSAAVAVPETAEEAHRARVHLHGDNLLFKFNSADVRRAIEGLHALAANFREALPGDFHVKAWIEIPAATCGVSLGGRAS